MSFLSAQYESHLKKLHFEASKAATRVLNSNLDDLNSDKGGDYDLLMAFELMRQLAHRLVLSHSGVPELLAIIQGEVADLGTSRDDNSDRVNIDIDKYREDKDEDLKFLGGEQFVTFKMQDLFGDYPGGRLEFGSPVRRRLTIVEEDDCATVGNAAKKKRRPLRKPDSPNRRELLPLRPKMQKSLK